MSTTEIHGLERTNLLVVLTVVQALQVLLLAVSVFVFFVLFGAVVMTHTVQQAWVQGEIHALPWASNLSVELLQVSVFLAAFAGLYFTVYAVTDETYRDQFFTQLKAELDRALGVRTGLTRPPARTERGRPDASGQPDRGVRRQLHRVAPQRRHRTADPVDDAGGIQAQVVQHLEGHAARGVGDVVGTQHGPERVPAHDQQHAGVARVPHLARRRRVQVGQCALRADQPREAAVDAVRRRAAATASGVGAPTGCRRRGRVRRPSRGR